MRTPGPDHPIAIEPAKQRWRAYFNGHVVADSGEAMVLKEADLPAVVYFPRADVGMEYMGRTERHSHCPYKGDASYYTLTMGGQIAENVAWSYEEPFEAVAPIRNRIAFYTDRVEVYPVDDAAVNPEHHAASQDMMDREQVDEIVQHTDAGDGTTQRDRWEPNVDVPGAHEGGVR
jgi:uncharacterized protein (DUF427 family)